MPWAVAAVETAEAGIVMAVVEVHSAGFAD